MDKKLSFEIVPDSCWGFNLRTLLSKKQWDFVKNDAKERSNHKCAICGRQSKRLEGHERWEYDEENAVQKLVDVIAVCKDCHSAIHIGRTQLVGDFDRASKHYMKVNNCSYTQFRKDLGEANDSHKRRNMISEWKLDVSWLSRFIND